MDGPYHHPARITGSFQLGVDFRYASQQVIAAPVLRGWLSPAARDERNQLSTYRNLNLNLLDNLDLNLDLSRDLHLNCLSPARGDHEACKHEKPGQGQSFSLGPHNLLSSLMETMLFNSFVKWTIFR